MITSLRAQRSNPSPQRKNGLLRRFAPSLGRKSLKNGVILPTSSLKLSSKAGRCLIHRSQLAMTANMPSRPRDAKRPGRARNFPPLEGVGNAGCPLHPRPRVHFVLVERTRATTSTPESPGIPARNGFNGFLRALVSAKSARMWERAVLTNRPLLDLSPFVLEGL